ncbi:hypothetical protein AG1IA_09028 [Rhizoctonia solani AG-1 IA]|uniref:Uncharacterized protein n=1 Tax=Thanatephorus cucumeris (strain AG1-IA) TaxID=983506 RepID=L8WJE9_THACA|nr:hypothetical protein AG1IA_09028 [Rhizoctonia solani AG-1 IA]
MSSSFGGYGHGHGHGGGGTYEYRDHNGMKVHRTMHGDPNSEFSHLPPGTYMIQGGSMKLGAKTTLESRSDGINPPHSISTRGDHIETSRIDRSWQIKSQKRPTMIVRGKRPRQGWLVLDRSGRYNARLSSMRKAYSQVRNLALKNYVDRDKCRSISQSLVTSPGLSTFTHVCLTLKGRLSSTIVGLWNLGARAVQRRRPVPHIRRIYKLLIQSPPNHYRRANQHVVRTTKTHVLNFILALLDLSSKLVYTIGSCACARGAIDPILGSRMLLSELSIGLLTSATLTDR